MVYSIGKTILFVLEIVPSDHSITVTLNKTGRPVAFFSRTSNGCEQKYSTIEKEAYAIVKTLCKWIHTN